MMDALEGRDIEDDINYFLEQQQQGIGPVAGVPQYLYNTPPPVPTPGTRLTCL